LDSSRSLVARSRDPSPEIFIADRGQAEWPVRCFLEGLRFQDSVAVYILLKILLGYAPYTPLSATASMDMGWVAMGSDFVG